MFPLSQYSRKFSFNFYYFLQDKMYHTVTTYSTLFCKEFEQKYKKYCVNGMVVIVIIIMSLCILFLSIYF